MPQQKNVEPIDCAVCDGACCRYVIIDIPTEPRSKNRFDEIIWFLFNPHIKILKEGRNWSVLVMGKCRNLDDKNRCRIYFNRPDLCRAYPEPADDGCHGPNFKHLGGRLFHSPEELLDYLGEERNLTWAREMKIVLETADRKKDNYAKF